MFRKEILTILAGVILFGVSRAQAVDVEFRSDAIIRPGDVFDVVSVYDTPPVPTVVHMFGGSVRILATYDSSIVNIHAGELKWGGTMRNLSTVNIYGGTIMLVAPGIGDSSTLNIYGGDVGMGPPGFDPLGTLRHSNKT